MHKYTDKCTQMHKYTNTKIHKYMYVYKYTNTHINKYKCTNILINKYTISQINKTQILMCAQIHTKIHIWASQKFTQAQIHIYIYKYIYTEMHKWTNCTTYHQLSFTFFFVAVRWRWCRCAPWSTSTLTRRLPPWRTVRSQKITGNYIYIWYI